MPVDDALQYIAALSGKQPLVPSAGEPIGQRVAQALGWQNGQARIEVLENGTGDLKLVRAFLGPQRAVVFAADGANSADKLLPQAALYAYHSTVHWGLIADELGAVVFNSHWLRNDDWFRLQEIPWAEVNQHEDLLRALTPEGVATGELDRVAARSISPDEDLDASG